MQLIVSMNILLQNSYIMISAVKGLIESKLKVFVYMIYECVLCIFIMYI